MVFSKQVAQVFGSLAKKVAEQALHAAVFSFVSNKVSSYLKKREKEEDSNEKSKEDSDKVRVESAELKDEDVALP